VFNDQVLADGIKLVCVATGVEGCSESLIQFQIENQES